MTAVKYHGGRNYKSTYHNTHRPTQDYTHKANTKTHTINHWLGLVAFCALAALTGFRAKTLSRLRRSSVEDLGDARLGGI